MQDTISKSGNATLVPPGRKVKFTSKVDPNLLGGIMVRIGDRMVDLSVLSRVNRIKASLDQGV